MENKKADRKGWSSSEELCPTSRGESFKYTTHHSNGWECTIMCSAMQRGCLSSNKPKLQLHVLAPAQPQEVLNTSRRCVSRKQFIASSSVQSHTPVCFIPARDIWGPWRAFGIRYTHLAYLLAVGACTIHTGRCQQKLLKKSFSFTGQAKTEHNSCLRVWIHAHSALKPEIYIIWILFGLPFAEKKAGNRKFLKSLQWI